MGERVGAAKRRWLRAWHHHERLTVAMELAAALHHGAQRLETVVEEPRKVEHETNNALRRQRTPPLGVRPGILAEPGPQRSDRRRSSGDALPTLSLPVFAGSGEAVDSAALHHLTAKALQAKWMMEEAEEEKRSLQLESANRDAG